MQTSASQRCIVVRYRRYCILNDKRASDLPDSLPVRCSRSWRKKKQPCGPTKLANGVDEYLKKTIFLGIRKKKQATELVGQSRVFCWLRIFNCYRRLIFLPQILHVIFQGVLDPLYNPRGVISQVRSNRHENCEDNNRIFEEVSNLLYTNDKKIERSLKQGRLIFVDFWRAKGIIYWEIPVWIPAILIIPK